MSLVTVATRCIPAALVLLVGASAPGGQSAPLSGFAPAVDTRDAPPGSTDLSVKRELELGGDYMLGRGVERNPELSAYWYRKAADQGDPGAENELGYFYSLGFGVPANPQQAAKWYERAMGGGSEAAKLNLAVMYLKAEGVRRDVNFALDLLRDLAKKDNATAENYLGIIYFSGYGVPADHGAAEKWFLQAMKHHSPEAEYSMGTLYSVVGDHAHDYAKAAELLRASARSGYVLAMHSLGLLLLNHPELGQKPDEAKTMLEAAAEAGSWRSSIALGIVAGKGQGGEANMADAYRWFLISVKQGGPQAEKIANSSLAECASLLNAEARDREKRKADAWLEQHPHADLFVLGHRYRNGPFPAAEVPILDLAEVD
jgi:TPR repeat protein